MASSSSTSSSSSSCVQPDHFYPSGTPHAQWRDQPGAVLDPDDDPFATRGIPVFRPTLEEFANFEAYMTKVEAWGRYSGIVKIIPPQQWTASLPSTSPLLPQVRLKSPIEQRMEGGSGLFRQHNIEKDKKELTIMDWAHMCIKDAFKSPSPKHTSRGRGSRDSHQSEQPLSANIPSPQTEASLVDNAELTDEEAEFYNTFNPKSAWLPADTNPSDYTPEACRNLERTFWRSCGIGKPAWYGADLSGSLFTDDTKTFNVAHLPSFLSRLTNGRPVPGVNTPYLYFGMWRATFAWHVEDMDLFSINYIHWGAPKFWYAIPRERSKAFENVMRGWFPSDAATCSEFLRHKSYLASPSLLAESSCKPNVLVQHQGEFVITFPRGYHAGFNLGLNCAESVNFALENWVELGRTAKICECVPDSVSINVDALLSEAPEPEANMSLKRKSVSGGDDALPGPSKRIRTPPVSQVSASTKSGSAEPSAPRRKMVSIVGPRVADASPPMCCLCPSTSIDSRLIRCVGRPSTLSSPSDQTLWAHDICARVLPETWIDQHDGEDYVYGIDCIVKDRWNLSCGVCSKASNKKSGAKIQCTKGKCPKAFHVTCAIENSEVAYEVVEEVQSDVVIIEGDNKNSAETSPVARPFKVVCKTIVSVLCPQHNPAVLEQRRQRRQEKMKNDILAIPPLSRIRVRVSNGVYEVTLLSVNEWTHTIQVVWGNGERKELRFGSIVWNNPAASTWAAADSTFPNTAQSTFTSSNPYLAGPNGLPGRPSFPIIHPPPVRNVHQLQYFVAPPTVPAQVM